MNEPIVKTSSGAVRGRNVQGVAAFKGIPYPDIASGRSACSTPWGTYLYEFAWPSPTCGGMLGACHGLELGFVFDTLDTPGLIGPQGLVGEDPPVELAKRVHQTWITFAATGDPGWAPFSTQQHQVMHITTVWELLNDPRPIERHAWDGAR